MKKQEVIELFDDSKLWVKDRYGNYTMTTLKGIYRVKVQDISVRLESQIIIPATQYSKEEKMWVRIGGTYLKDCSVGNSETSGNLIFILNEQHTKRSIKL